MNTQPETFSFDAEHAEKAKAFIAKYPEGRQASAVLPLLDLAQRQNGGWLPGAAVEYVAEMLDMAEIRVWEVASFYTMYNLEPVGKTCVNVCTTTPCWLRGSADIVTACEEELNIGLGETTGDGEFTLREVECLGACVNAPMLQIGDDYYEDLTPDSAKALLRAIKAGDTSKPGPQSGREGSEPISGLTSLKGDA
ncbi:MAG: NADH-quinone oxidoreductase subunit NuoE [Rhodospirillales bacterium]|jgi:NADH-quinone oxidoreductase subunit E|nr:NADH-quinone oxidoreductase subunit NuoE [Rhodospirillales bacterium]MBT4007596.1 NADH-quinone oxidoreductase subunit NuoE [Rhodospirillales bacterium]MBT5076340.1 NADH-quinone oxidoreductase subunit NuoE [Rhodospirillales bacterium]MBT5112703.1 NADH-quinone oxidoreductase subunit NuoE [Rhodospirillales bacterium]MBT5673473.1 NADH-quinone oxidoreductase subunit NuoE [Rhodospirillales bacterium]